MNIISFAYTMPALLADQKSVTRRDWPDKYAEQFHPGDRVQAYDKGARFGGKCGAIIQLEDLHREPLERLIEDPEYARTELIKEGNLWPTLNDFLLLFAKLRHGPPFRIQFHLHDIVGKQLALPLLDPVPSVHAEFCRLTRQEIKLSVFAAHWHELLAVHKFTPEDVALVARYLLREIKAGKRKESCLKIQWFTRPVNFASDLPLARRAFPPRASRPPSVTPQSEPPASDDFGREVAAKLADFRRNLRRGNRHA